MSTNPQYDVAIVGASLAGNAAARFYGQSGLSVAVIDQHPALDWHKRLCTHYIQPSAVSAIQQLGLESLIEQAGGVRARLHVWARWGWIRPSEDSPPESYGYSIRRETLDPVARQLTAETPGVDMLLGWKADALLRDGKRVTGVSVHNTASESQNISARLVVGADGRQSNLADMAQVKTKIKPNNRFTYFAYYRGISPNQASLWMLDPDVAYMLPCEEGITLLCCWVTKDKLSEFRANREESFLRMINSLPDGPDLSQAERISEIIGSVDLPLITRAPSRPGLALIGDAALAGDPLNGVGCGWAIQSAHWLTDCTSQAFASKSTSPLDRALRRYSRRHWRELSTHQRCMAAYARGHTFTLLERIYHCAAARNAGVAEAFLDMLGRRIQPYRLLSPFLLSRVLWANLRS